VKVIKRKEETTHLCRIRMPRLCKCGCSREVSNASSHIEFTPASWGEVRIRKNERMWHVPEMASELHLPALQAQCGTLRGLL